MPGVIVVIGEALIDLLVRPDGRIEATAGGGPFNTARTIARLGQRVAFAGRLSTDAFGRRLRDRLAGDGVDLGLAVETDDPTTLAVVESGTTGEADYRFYLAGTSAPGLALDAVGAIGRPAALHIGTLGLVLEPIGSTAEAVVGGMPPETLVMADLNARPAATPDHAAWVARIGRLVRRVDVLKASVDDLLFFRPDAGAIDAATTIVDAGPRVVLLTDGAGPVRIVTAGGTQTVEPPRVEVVDTVGAGDAFGGGFLAAWIGAGRGRAELTDSDALLEATSFAVRVASITCTRPGADPPTTSELSA
jgi:fructokinase